MAWGLPIWDNSLALWDTATFAFSGDAVVRASGYKSQQVVSMRGSQLWNWHYPAWSEMAYIFWLSLDVARPICLPRLSGRDVIRAGICSKEVLFEFLILSVSLFFGLDVRSICRFIFFPCIWFFFFFKQKSWHPRWAIYHIWTLLPCVGVWIHNCLVVWDQLSCQHFWWEKTMEGIALGVGSSGLVRESLPCDLCL